MASKGLSRSLRCLSSGNCTRDAIGRGFQVCQPRSLPSRGPVLNATQGTFASTTSRSITTQAAESTQNAHLGAAPVIQSAIPEHIVAPSVTTTVYNFPTMEPLRLESYPSNLLNLPLRRDILHRAVVFEGDMSRQGTASTKWRGDVHGSGRKIRPQKGTGMARLGDKKSPMLRGGGVAFGPKPRDFATELPRKIYDLAWRTALSHRYRRGELLIVNKMPPAEDDRPEYLRRIMEQNGWVKGMQGYGLFITKDEMPDWQQLFFEAGNQGRMLATDEVDVKNLLEMNQLIVEQEALDFILRRHQSDLGKPKGIHNPSLE
jgi:large subunit ribosomal protein L4